MAKKAYTREEVDEMTEMADKMEEILNDLRHIARVHGESRHESYVLAHLETSIGEGRFVDKYEDTLRKWIKEAEESIEPEEDEDEEEEDDDGD